MLSIVVDEVVDEGFSRILISSPITQPVSPGPVIQMEPLHSKSLITLALRLEGILSKGHFLAVMLNVERPR